MKKFLKKISAFFVGIGVFIDKKIVIPVTKFVIALTSKFDNSGRQFESWLSKSNTILYISLLLSVIVFIVVDQKIITFTESSAEVLRSQPVVAVYNEEAYVIEGLPETVDITLIGSKADLYFAKQSPSQDVTVDLSDLKTGQHRVTIRYNQALPSIDYKVNPSVATVIIYPKISKAKKLTVDVLNRDSLDEKLVITNIDIENDEVIVKGAEYQLNKVASVKALVDVKNLTSQEVGTTTLKNIPLRAYDEAGNVLNVEIVPGTIEADITIASPSKDVPIKVIPSGELSFGKAISSIDINATSVTVYGDEAALLDLKYVPVTIDVSGLKTNQQYKLELTKPVGVNAMSVNNVTINVALGDSVDVEVPNVRIDVRNLDETKYKAQGASLEDTEITVLLKGVKEVIDQIILEGGNNIVAYVDLSGYGVGTHEVEVFVEGSDLKVEYVPKTKKVTIKISNK